MYRSTQNYENQQKMLFDGVGEYGIPQIEPTSYNPCEFISFNYAKSCKDRADHGIHFFIDDYQFTRLWTQPDTYINMLQDFKCVMSPDFSTYTSVGVIRNHSPGVLMVNRLVDLLQYPALV